MRLRNLLTLVAVLALVVTACAGGTDAETTTTTAAAEETTTTTTTVPETTTTTSAPEETTTTTSGGGSSVALAGLRESLMRSSQATKGRMAGSMTITGVPDLPGEAFVVPFNGAFDNEAGNFSFVMDMSFMASQVGEEMPPEFAGLLGDMEVRTIGDTSYIRFPFFATFLGAQTEWIAAPVEEGVDATSGLAGATPGNPAAFLEAFDQADGTVEEVGREAVRGVEATHYLVVFDMEELLANATPEERAQIEAQGPLPIDRLPMDLWISDDGLVLKYLIEFVGSDLALPAEESFESMVMEFEMFDYGEDIVIEAPPADQITNMEDLDFFGFGEL